MDIDKKSGTKDRLFEMMERVNNMKLNESPMWGDETSQVSADNNIPNRDDKVIDKFGNNKLMGESQINYVDEEQELSKSKYFNYILQGSDATEENAIQAAQDLDWSEIETSEGNYSYLNYVDTINGVGIYYNMGDDSYYFTDKTGSLQEQELSEISWAGIKSAGKKIGSDIGNVSKSIGKSVKNVVNTVSDSVNKAVNTVSSGVKNYADGVIKSYHKGARNGIITDLEKMATQFAIDFSELIDKINDRAQKAGDEPINKNSLAQTISNTIRSKQPKNVNFNKFKNEGLREEDEFEESTEETGFDDKIEGGLGDDAQPSDFNPEQISKGIAIEMEHTNDPKIALEITMDHLSEMPDYYDHLDTMESNVEENGFESEKEDCGCHDEESPEDSLLDPSTHWVDHYSPKNISNNDEITDESVEYKPSF